MIEIYYHTEKGDAENDYAIETGGNAIANNV